MPAFGGRRDQRERREDQLRFVEKRAQAGQRGKPIAAAQRVQAFGADKQGKCDEEHRAEIAFDAPQQQVQRRGKFGDAHEIP